MTPYKTALITGAAAGIGRALAFELAKKDIAIAAVDVHEDGLRSLADDLAKKNGRCAGGLPTSPPRRICKQRRRSLDKELGPIDFSSPMPASGRKPPPCVSIPRLRSDH